MTDPAGLAPVALGVALAAVALAWVLRPLARGALPLEPPDPRAVALLARREAIVAGLRDLDADHADGRLDDAAHAEARRILVAEGVATLAALDRMASEAEGGTAALVAAIEAEVAALLAAGGAGSEGRATVCGRCGEPLRPSDNFCPRCGAPTAARREV